jgi:hypothetical protein
MANFIPRLEWNDISIVGNTAIASNVITSVVSTAAVIDGMIINHANFPANSYVLSHTINSITVSVNATANGVAVSLALFQRIDFDYPSSKQVEPQYLPTESISESLGGIRQVQINNILKKIELEFRFVTNTLKLNLENNWFLLWAVYGKEFRYFESKDELSNEVYSLDNFDFKPTREIAKAGNFLYKIAFKFRRVYL